MWGVYTLNSEIYLGEKKAKNESCHLIVPLIEVLTQKNMWNFYVFMFIQESWYFLKTSFLHVLLLGESRTAIKIDFENLFFY